MDNKERIETVEKICDNFKAKHLKHFNMFLDGKATLQQLRSYVDSVTEITLDRLKNCIPVRKKSYGTIGDLHGHNTWLQIIEQNPDIDVWILIGDYVDSKHLSNETILDNLRAIIEFKKKHPDRIILLWGNHDIQYLFLPDAQLKYRCDGFRPEISEDLRMIFNDNRNLFQVAYQVNLYLWTHAGISIQWAKELNDYCSEHGLKQMSSMADFLNELNESRHREVLHQIGWSRSRFPSKKSGGITWADRDETKNDFISGVHQIVGHTRVQKIERIERNSMSSITYVDCLGAVKDFYKVEIEE
jgi:hypothetical protein